jgi:D-alanyl-D-alanine carboxypeptidase (penicillin-binding protein 5/6)
MKCPEKEDMYSDTIKLFETAFAEKKARRRLIAKGVQKEMLALQGSSKPLKAYLKEDASLEYYPSEEPNVRCFLKWEELSLPIEKDSLVARLDFQDEKGHVLLSGPLFAFEEVRYSRTFLLLSFVKRHYILLSAFSFIGFFMLLRARKFL